MFKMFIFRRATIIVCLFLVSIVLFGRAAGNSGDLSSLPRAAAAVPSIATSAVVPQLDTSSPTTAPVVSPTLTMLPTPSPTISSTILVTSSPTVSATVTPVPVSATPSPSATITPPAHTPTPRAVAITWMSPTENDVVHADILTLTVRVLPGSPGQPGVDHVTFSATWPREGDVPASHAVACVTRPAASNVAAIASCAWNVRNAGVPNGPLVVSTTAIDTMGHMVVQVPGVRHVLVSQPMRKAIVLLQGVCTALDHGASTTNTTFTALQNLLKTAAYRYADADFLIYSYKGGTLNAQGQWVHQAYGLSDPIRQNFHSTSWSALHDQLLVPYHRRHPNTTFVLVGHSLGGMVAWEELKREMAAPATPSPLVSAVLTIDSPLHGITRPEVLLANLLRLDPQIGSQLDCVMRGQAANVLLDVHLAPHTATDLVALANHAVQRHIAVTTVGNADDCVWSPNRCGIPLSSIAATQWITGSQAHAIIFTIPLPCTRPEAYCFVGTHGAVLTNTNGPQALRQIAAVIGPQVPTPR